MILLASREVRAIPWPFSDCPASCILASFSPGGPTSISIFTTEAEATETRMMWGWSRIGERVTPRDLRAAMPTLLARRGVKEETLKMLGRWKSNAFNSYIRKGRENDWGEAKNALQMVLN